MYSKAHKMPRYWDCTPEGNLTASGNTRSVLSFIDDSLIYSNCLQQKNNVKEKKIYFNSLYQSDFWQKKKQIVNFSI